MIDYPAMIKILDTLTTFVVLVVALGAGASLYARRPQEKQTTPVPKAPIALQGLPWIGSPTAPFAILEFSDFECPFCGKYATETYPQIKAKMIDSGQFLFVFANFPLPFHKSARAAAEAAICAPDFFTAHDFLFAHQDTLADALLRVPRGVNPDEDGKRSPLECAESVNNSIALGQHLGVTGTPTFFVGELHDHALTVKSVVVGSTDLATLTKETK